MCSLFAHAHRYDFSHPDCQEPPVLRWDGLGLADRDIVEADRGDTVVGQANLAGEGALGRRKRKMKNYD